MIILKAHEAKKEIRRFRGIANKATDAGLKKVLKPSQKILQDATPVEEAILKKGIGLKNLTQREKGRYGIGKKTRAVKLGFIRKTKDAKLRQIEKKITLPALASILSYGAKAHMIKAKKAKALLYGASGFKEKVIHPGVKGSGFLQRAFNRMETGSTALFYSGVDEYMKKHAA